MQGGTIGGSNEFNRVSSGGGGGLARFKSAPATWLDALLEDDPNTTQPLSTTLTHLLTSDSTSSPSTTITTTYIPDPDPGFFEQGGGTHQVTSPSAEAAFQRMNSSPAEFLSGNADGYYSSYGYDFVGPTSTADVDVSSRKRLRDTHHHSDHPSHSFASHRRGEQSASGLLDMEMDKLFEDSVPCRVRAKRGCATHPRSIAERVRRTRISDRIRKLQELVPNMDKQTNTADMLEEAVEYVKTLQKQIQELTELQKKCTCMVKV